MTKEETLQRLIHGANKDTGLVACERVSSRDGAEEMLLFVRHGHEIKQIKEPFTPFLWIQNENLLKDYPHPLKVQKLAGGNKLKRIVFSNSWKEQQALIAWLKKRIGRNPSDPNAPYFVLNDPIQQHLMRTGRTLFKGMRLEDLRRLQVDIETYTDPAFEFSNPERESDRVIAIALSDQSGWTEVISGEELDEKEMLTRFVHLVKEKDPDVIEGHNLFKFDLPYLKKRAARHQVKLALGRDGSELSSKPGRYIVADRAISYPKIAIFGRHIIDTFFLAQAYDVSHRSLESLTLKHIAVHFGVAAPNRTYLEGSKIAETFRKDPAKVMRYAKDDILETRAISDLLSPSYFVQAQMLPFSYQNVCVRGSGAKIDALLLREYLYQEHAIPLPDRAREFAGGYTDMFFTGVAENVHHADVRSLYPSLMLTRKIGPTSDDLGVFLKLLDYLRALRIEAKEKMKKSASENEKHHLDALQSTFKILINSFYGYLGFSQARFSDFTAAETVTADGRALLKSMIEWIEKHGGKPIEIDTDGIYFVPPPFSKESELTGFQEAFRKSLPKGIEIEFDGQYKAMFSYKMKNYALLENNGEIIIKGAALKSRGLEPFQRSFMRKWLRLELEGKQKEIPALADAYHQAIENREWPIQKLAKTETLQDAPSTYQAKIQKGGRGRNAAYELALRSGRDYRAGDQVSYYVTGTKKSVPVHSSAKLVSEWDPKNRDENTAYYLAKLDALCKKFNAVGTKSGDGHPELNFG